VYSLRYGTAEAASRYESAFIENVTVRIRFEYPLGYVVLGFNRVRTTAYVVIFTDYKSWRIQVRHVNFVAHDLVSAAI
jgi:hypothetical protein